MNTKNTIEIFDTTLRDGAQTPGISFSLQDKLKITQLLDELGVKYIEGGWPGSNPKDVEYFNRIKSIKLKCSKIVAFGSTRRKNVVAEKDNNLIALVNSGVKTVCIFGKTWKLHIEKTLQTTPKENLKMIQDSIKFLIAHNLEVIYDAEHFFDGFKSDKSYALACLETAFLCGAKTLVMCDTNGGCLPHEISEIVSQVIDHFSRVAKQNQIVFGIHAHNDSDCAVANSISAVLSGCSHVQGTINGLGERCGNANLCSIIPALQLKLKYKVLSEENLKKLTEVSRKIDEIANLVPNERQPYVGANSFAHKGGVHASAVYKLPKSYEHINPKLVGNERKILLSELAGKSNLLFKQKWLSVELSEENITKIIRSIKQKEFEGYSYENAEGSFVVLVHKMFSNYKPFFEIKGFRVIIEHRPEKKELITEATIKLVVKNNEVHVVAEGDGPVNALDNALRKALEKYYPTLKNMKLTDFKVRVVNPAAGTAAKVRVNIESIDEKHTWNTVGVSENIIEASWEALLDAVEYKLLKTLK